MINLDITAIKICPKKQKTLLNDGFDVTYEYGWKEPSKANEAKADNAIQTNTDFSASNLCSWNGSISFYSNKAGGEVKVEGS
jgi:hypothetical protein